MRAGRNLLSRFLSVLLEPVHDSPRIHETSPTTRAEHGGAYEFAGDLRLQAHAKSSRRRGGMFVIRSKRSYGRVATTIPEPATRAGVLRCSIDQNKWPLARALHGRCDNKAAGSDWTPRGNKTRGGGGGKASTSPVFSFRRVLACARCER